MGGGEGGENDDAMTIEALGGAKSKSLADADAVNQVGKSSRHHVIKSSRHQVNSSRYDQVSIAAAASVAADDAAVDTNTGVCVVDRDAHAGGKAALISVVTAAGGGGTKTGATAIEMASEVGLYSC